jgi:cyanophycinase
VFFAGGDQARITQAMVREDGSRSALLDAVWDLYRRGGVVAGTSAGAAIMSSTMFFAPRTVFGVLASGVQEGREIAPGLGFIGDDIFIDQHLLVRGRFARMIPAMLAKGYKLGLGIDEDTAMVIDSKRRLEIVGATGALMIDLRQAGTDAERGGFNVSNALISYLDHGDQYDLAAHTFVPPADKVRARPLPLGNEVPQHIFSADILGANALVKLMDSLVKNQRPQAYGVAISGPNDPPPRMAFQFTVSKTADSVSYAKPDGARPSILNLRLDIRPLDLGRASAPQ